MTTNTNAYLIHLGTTQNYTGNAGFMSLWNQVQSKVEVQGAPGWFLFYTDKQLVDFYNALGKTQTMLIVPIDIDAIREIQDTVDLPGYLTQFLGAKKSQAA